MAKKAKSLDIKESLLKAALTNYDLDDSLTAAEVKVLDKLRKNKMTITIELEARDIPTIRDEVGNYCLSDTAKKSIRKAIG
jgi:hypothetical protein